MTSAAAGTGRRKDAGEDRRRGRRATRPSRDDGLPLARQRRVPFRNQGVWDAVGELVRQREADLGRPLRVLDLGGGSGGLAVPLAELGHEVTVVDPSPNALAALERRAADFGVADRVTGRQGDADSLSERARASTSSAATASSRSSTTPPRRSPRSPPCSPPRATSRSSWPGGSRSSSPRLSPASSARRARRSPAPTAGGARPTRCRAGSTSRAWSRSSTRPASRRSRSTGSGSSPISSLRAALDSAADREALTELERAVATHPQYAEALGSLGAGHACHRPAVLRPAARPAGMRRGPSRAGPARGSPRGRPSHPPRGGGP